MNCDDLLEWYETKMGEIEDKINSHIEKNQLDTELKMCNDSKLELLQTELYELENLFYNLQDAIEYHEDQNED
jgi:hypothetical protein